jgi:hypothetical protein
LFLLALGEASSRTVALQVVQCLQEDFLLKLPTPGHNHYWPQSPTNQNWRYLYRRQIGILLRWPQQYFEGDPRRIPAFLNTYLRTKGWPVDGDEARCEESSSATPAGSAPNANRENFASHRTRPSEEPAASRRANGKRIYQCAPYFRATCSRGRGGRRNRDQR